MPHYICATNSRNGIVLQPTKTNLNLNLKIFVDAEFAGGQDSRRIVMGQLIYLNNTVIWWNSKAMSSVTLSLTEMEYEWMSEGLMI